MVTNNELPQAPGRLGDLGYHVWRMGGNCRTYGRAFEDERWEQLMLQDAEGYVDISRCPGLDEPVVLYSYRGVNDEEGTVEGRWETLRDYLAAN